MRAVGALGTKLDKQTRRMITRIQAENTVAENLTRNALQSIADDHDNNNRVQCDRCEQFFARSYIYIHRSCYCQVNGGQAQARGRGRGQD